MSAKPLSLRIALADICIDFFGQGNAVARVLIVRTIREKYPHLNSPTLDRDVAVMLNYLVDNGTLQRTGRGSFRRYMPAARYFENQST